MKNYLWAGYLLSFLCLAGTAQSQVLYVNEVMASNASSLADGSGAYEDWVEIYNPGSVSVDIGGYYVSDKPEEPAKYQLPTGDPATVIPANGYLILWASDEPSRGTLHLPFKLSAGGEAFVLTGPNGNSLIDSVVFGEQETDVSYGRQPDGSSNLLFFAPATPGASNNNATVYVSAPAPPVFSAAAGFYTSNVQLTLQTADPAVTIYYTLDGSNPSPDHVGGTTYEYKNRYVKVPGELTGGRLPETFETYVYSSPLTLTDRATEPNKISLISSTYDNYPDYFPQQNINKTNVVRAVAVKPGGVSSEIITKSYFIDPQGRARYTLPVASVSLPENRLFDYQSGIYTAGVDFDNWRNANPNALTIGFVPANYERRGDENEILGNFEYYETGNQPVLNQDVGFRIHGGATRALPRKSLRLYARSEYGESKLEHQFFKSKPENDFKRLILRNSGNDWARTLFRDAVIQRVVQHLPFDIQASQPTVTFIDGEYWGIQTLRERQDDHYLEETYDVDRDSVDILENMWNVDEGSNAHYLAMLNFLNSHSLANQADYDYLTTQMDVDNFLNYQIAEIFSANHDGFGNNIKYWRKQTAYDPSAPYGQDGRWRWLMYDLDAGYELPNHPTLDRATGGQYTWQSVILRSLLENAAFKNRFINRYADLLNTTFKTSRVQDFINAYKSELEPEIDEHIARWRHPANRAAWESEVDVMLDFAQQRPAVARDQVRNKFGLSAQHHLTLGVSDTSGGYIRINTIDIASTTPGVDEAPYPWTGVYFQNVPVTLTARTRPGRVFSYWQEDGATITTDSLLVLPTLTADRTLTAVYDGSPPCQEECRSLSSGNWFDTGRWSCGHVPLACEAVIISEGQTVNLPAGNAVAKSVRIENGALLDMGNDASLQLGN